MGGSYKVNGQDASSHSPWTTCLIPRARCVCAILNSTLCAIPVVICQAGHLHCFVYTCAHALLS